MVGLKLIHFEMFLRFNIPTLFSEVDDNPDYDNLDIVSRDAEERYFDEDEDEEEEEDETDMIQQ